jgi:hypothetical protein
MGGAADCDEDQGGGLVAGELERRWNAALGAVETLEKELEAVVRQRPAALECAGASASAANGC